MALANALDGPPTAPPDKPKPANFCPSTLTSSLGSEDGTPSLREDCVLAAASPAVMTWPPWRVDGDPDEERLVRRPTDDGRAPGGSAKAPAVGDGSVLLAIRIGLLLEAVAAGGDAPVDVGLAPELRRDKRDGLREASDSLL